jgi:hypothetical protein
MNEKEKEIWSDKGISILCLEIEFFSFRAKKISGAINRINRYYLHMNKQLARYCKSRLLPKSLSDYRDALKYGKVFIAPMVTSKTKLCCNTNGLLSLYTDITEYDGRESFTVRLGDSWCLYTGCPLPMSSFFSKKANYKKLLKTFVAKEVQRRKDYEFSDYYDHVRKNCSRHFSTDRFYITADGLTIFYPMCSIASRAESIPTFTMHWSETGPRGPNADLSDADSLL